MFNVNEQNLLIEHFAKYIICINSFISCLIKEFAIIKTIFCGLYRIILIHTQRYYYFNIRDADENVLSHYLFL